MGRRRFQSPELRQTEGDKPKWYCRYYKSVRDIAGNERRVEKREYFGFVATTKPLEAKKRHAKFVNELNRDAFGVIAEATVGEWIKEYRTIHFPTLKRTTQRVYDVHIDQHIADYFQAVKFSTLDRPTVQKWMNGLIRKGLAMSTRKVLAGVLASILNSAEDAGVYTGPNLMRRINYGPEGQVYDSRLLTWGHLEAILPSLPKDTQAMARIAVATGMRFSEIIGLRWQDVDFEQGLIRVRQRRYRRDIDSPKSKNGRRDIPMGGLAPLFEGMILGGELIFPRTASNYQDELRSAAKVANCYWLGFGWHALRRLHATFMAQQGANLIDLSRTMGHASVDMTAKYVILSGENMDARSKLEGKIM